ncbi:MAG: peroxidase family protein, partial [Hyphomicrobium sp.]
DQNQAYGSNELVGQLLRESDGAGGVGSHLVQGIVDPSNPDFRLLPTLRELLDHHRINETVFKGGLIPAEGVTLLEYYGNTLFDPATGTYNAALVADLASDFMGSTHALLLDTNPGINLLDHFVAGDGRANENVSLTAVHTIWARNHNFHVDNLNAAGFGGTPEQVFQAAKALNEAEYQRVVFDEFADMLFGGIQGAGTHGHAGYDANADAGISHEFAAAVYRIGHSLISDTLTVIGADGQPQHVRLVDAFLNPTNDPASFNGPPPPGYQPQPGFAQLGAGSIISGTIAQAAEEVDFNIVDAVRNDLVRIRADLFAFNVARGRDVGLGTLNQVRQDLRDSTDPYVQEARSFAGNLDPYSSWEDFQQRNGLSDAVIAQFKQAYPDLVLAAADIADFNDVNPGIDVAVQANGTGVVKGIDRVDLWVGGLAEQHINGGVAGQTFFVVLHEQFDRLQQADRFYYTDRFDNFDLYQNIIDGQNFSDIIARNTGLTGLPESVFQTNGPVANIAIDDLAVPEFSVDDTIVGTLSAINVAGGAVTFALLDDADGRFEIAGNALRVADGLRLDFEQVAAHAIRVAVYVNGVITAERTFLVSIENVKPETVFGDSRDNVFVGGSGTDNLYGAGGSDRLNGGAGIDHMYGGTGNDIYYADTYLDDVKEAVGEGTLDQVFASANYALTAGAEVERLGTASQLGTSSITLIGNGFSQELHGNNGKNTLSGGGGIDSFAGYDGDDIYVVDHASEQITETAGRGSDAVYTTVSFTLAAGVSIERLAATPQASTNAINLTGNEIRQVIAGNDGSNTLKGGGGNDSLYGMGSGDIIEGGDGNDHLFGGAGVDYFQFSQPYGAASGIDRIYDFTAADFIRINAADVASSSPLAAAAFVLGAAAVDANDRVMYDQLTGILRFDADGTGSQVAKILAVLDTKPVVTAADFQLF